MSWCDSLQTSPAKVVYFALVVVILVLAFMTVRKVAEGLENPNYIYSSGATQRFATEFTSANQGDYTTGYNFEADIPPAAQEVTVVKTKAKKDLNEYLTGSPEAPVQPSVGGDLYAYKQGVTGQTLGLDAGRHGMGMKNMTTEHMMDDPYESLLHQELLA